jgi:hypothetical protein
VVLSAKFCRQCGNTLDASEMTTRSLDAPSAEPPPFDNPTRPANAGITSPTYVPPAMMQPPPIIGNAPPANNRTALLVFLALGLTMLIGLGVVAFVVLGKFSRPPLPPPAEPPPLTSQKAPPPPEHPNLIPHPPLPPPEPSADPRAGSVSFPFDASLIYPGAKTLMSVNSKDGKVAQLQTADPFDKVTEWYKDKIDATEEVNMPGNRILSGKGYKVILNGSGAGTVITITDDKD